jgi:ammonia channel protein AmtB
MLRRKPDDPLDAVAVAVHGTGALVGIIFVPWFINVGLERGAEAFSGMLTQESPCLSLVTTLLVTLASSSGLLVCLVSLTSSIC